jgi:Arc/MetJ family transcription regulator
MRTTITLDDELLAKAIEMTGITERSTLIHDGLRALIQREAGRRLALLGGSAPGLRLPPRRRPAVAAKTAREASRKGAASKASAASVVSKTPPRPSAK